jgi:alpha-amylase/alpha-mannosidase (GH57 family)
MRPFVIHTHFYQPERLNPWTGALDPEPSAAPDRDWNERVLRECYQPNGAARIYGSDGLVLQIVNNYELLSFNFGPTLLGWMEHAHPVTYQRVLDGDRRARARTGYGNAIAQAYNHMILPLANERDRLTQIRWGLADFCHHFGRDPKGLWLPETAVNQPTIDTLIDCGVGFTVLAPHQVERVRTPGGQWQDAKDHLQCGQVYRHCHSDGSGRSVAVFVYDGELAQALAFDPATGDTQTLLDRLKRAGEQSGLIHAALDGETFGHHHHFRELGLAHALFEAAQARGLEPTSYEAYLATHPPVHELEVTSGEGTAWSCAHGVGRWYRNCGCATDSMPGWNQHWRTPLRQALDVVRDAAIAAFEEQGSELLRDPWAARDDYIGVRLGTWPQQTFLQHHAKNELDDASQVDLWTLLEAQRHAMVMYTSCGWFFADISGIETRYVLRSAHRVMGLLEELGFLAPWQDVLSLLGEAQSNKPEAGTGADIWRDHIEPAAVGPPRVAAHLTVVGLVRALEPEFSTAGHRVSVHSHRREQRGYAALSTASLTVTSLATGRHSDLAVAAVHLGGLDVYGSVSLHYGDEAFRRAERRLWQAFPTVPIPRLLRLVAEVLPSGEFGFEQLLPDGVQEFVGAVFSNLRTRFREQYARLYHDHQRVLEMLVAAGYTLPRELRAPAELTLASEIERLLAGADTDPGVFGWIRATVDLARTQGYRLDLEPVSDAVTTGLIEATRKACASLAPADADAVEGWLQLANDLGVDVNLARAQELIYDLVTRSDSLGPYGVDIAARLGRAVRLAPQAWAS